MTARPSRPVAPVTSTFMARSRAPAQGRVFYLCNTRPQQLRRKFGRVEARQEAGCDEHEAEG